MIILVFYNPDYVKIYSSAVSASYWIRDIVSDYLTPRSRHLAYSFSADKNTHLTHRYSMLCRLLAYRLQNIAEKPRDA